MACTGVNFSAAGGRTAQAEVGRQSNGSGRTMLSGPVCRVWPSGTPGRCRNCLKKAKLRQTQLGFGVVGAGIEPATLGFSVRCSTN